MTLDLQFALQPGADAFWTDETIGEVSPSQNPAKDGVNLSWKLEG
jgi:hypothetical protein